LFPGHARQARPALREPQNVTFAESDLNRAFMPQAGWPHIRRMCACGIEPPAPFHMTFNPFQRDRD